ANLAEETEKLALHITGAGKAAFVIENDTTPPPALHLSDLIPGWKRANSVRHGGHLLSPPTPVAAAAPARPAIRTGEPIQTEIPRNLATALQHAVSQFGDQGTIYIQEDERESFQAYRDLLADAERILKSLRRMGAQPQDQFIFQFRRNQDFIPAF